MRNTCLAYSPTKLANVDDEHLLTSVNRTCSIVVVAAVVMMVVVAVVVVFVPAVVLVV